MNTSVAIKPSDVRLPNATQNVVLPNVRKLFIPDPGWTIFDVDLAGADAQVVAWEADDEDLKNAFRAGLDVHAKNAGDMLGTAFTSLEPETPKWSKLRKQYKQAVHGTNYGGSPRALNQHPGIGWPMAECTKFQTDWFKLHPKIKANFHEKTIRALHKNNTIQNAFGFRRVFFDRPDANFTEALAWIPQSTVALVTFYGGIQLERTFKQNISEEEYRERILRGVDPNPHLKMLLQVHDSLVFQVRHEDEDRVAEMAAALRVEIPYPDPLYIPWGFARSRKSWGDCEKVPDHLFK